MVRRLARLKIYVDRSRGYMALVQLALIGWIAIQQADIPFLQRMIEDRPVLTFGIAIITTLAGSLTIGRLDTLLGMRREELRNNHNESPVFREILDRLREKEID